MSNKSIDVVSASEIASWEWCPEAWRLGALGGAPVNESELARGKSFHEGAARVETYSRQATVIGRWLFACGLVLVAVLLVLLKVVG